MDSEELSGADPDRKIAYRSRDPDPNLFQGPSNLNVKFFLIDKLTHKYIN